MKAAQALGKGHPDYDPTVYYGDLLWTQVIARGQMGADVVVTFPFGSDIAADRKVTKFKVKGKSKFGNELYSPDGYESEKLPLKVEQHKISE